MIFDVVLLIHSYWRWLVLGSVIFMIIKSYISLKKNNIFTQKDKRIQNVVLGVFYVQLILGFILYYLSPLVKHFFQNMSEAIHLREQRFFSIEHALMMFVAVVIVTMASVKLNKKQRDIDKHKTNLKWFALVLLIIIINIPWQNWPLVNRPNFRGL